MFLFPGWCYVHRKLSYALTMLMFSNSSKILCGVIFNDFYKLSLSFNRLFSLELLAAQGLTLK